jgi:hypothetical protein
VEDANGVRIRRETALNAYFLYSPYGPDHGVGHSRPSGASVQKHTVLNNSLSDNDLPERKCERQNNAVKSTDRGMYGNTA